MDLWYSSSGQCAWTPERLLDRFCNALARRNIGDKPGIVPGDRIPRYLSAAISCRRSLSIGKRLSWWGKEDDKAEIRYKTNNNKKFKKKCIKFK